MRKPANVDDLATRLTQAATAPLVPPAPAVISQKRPTTPVFLRLPSDLYARLEQEAVARTKATGKGVNVQHVILDKLAGAI
jgi:hypothetical protein